MRHHLVRVALGIAVTLPGLAPLAAAEKLPEGAVVAKLEASPPQIALTGEYAYAQVLVTAELTNGDRLDVSRMVQGVVTNDLASVSP
ncbi:MAG TPA: hypothetical protein VFW87_13745, partial [Pirellulales bacterium]|nr:hypothetical protein [Pirellulales bacterium]